MHAAVGTYKYSGFRWKSTFMPLLQKSSRMLANYPSALYYGHHAYAGGYKAGALPPLLVLVMICAHLFATVVL
eukprot:scaffold236671_cov17-Tisochrysis_lutea.AAC.2